MERLVGRAPEHICQLLQQDCSGCVEMVNSRGIYLHIKGKRILLCHDRYGVVPNGIATGQWDRLPDLFSPDQPIRVEKQRLWLPCVAMELELESIPKDTSILIPTETALLSAVETLLAQAKESGLSSLVYPLFTKKTPTLNPYCTLALPYVQGLLSALKEENTDAICKNACALMGLGPGLTPSGDDLLSGLVYGLRHSPFRNSIACNALITTIRKFAPERTNAVSADYLLAMAEDAPFTLMAEAWKDPAAGAALMQIGSNSGSEMLLGLLCAGSVLSA